MSEIKIFRVLKACPDQKIRAFELYIQSPYFKMTDAARSLGIIFISAIRSDQDFDKQDWLSTDQRSEAGLRQLCNELMKHFEQFLSIEGFQKERYSPLEMFIKEIDVLGLTQLLPKAKKTMDRLVQKKENLQAYDHYHRFRIGQLIADIEKTDETPLNDIYLSQNLEQLDNFYFVEKLRLQNDINQRKRVSKKQFNNHLFSEIVQLINKNTSNLLVRTFYVAHQMQQEPESEIHIRAI